MKEEEKEQDLIETTIIKSLTSKIISQLLPFQNSEIHDKNDNVTHIVIHFSSNIILKPNNPYIPEDVIDIFKKFGISAHYLIGRDGTIFKLVEESRNAYHAGAGYLTDYPSYKDNLNKHSIGIELLAIRTESEMKEYISSEVYQSIPEENIGYTEEQYASLNFLLPLIYDRYDIDQDRVYVIGHEEYSLGRKVDPGSLFDWSKIGL